MDEPIKTAIVTGSESGIGCATVTELLKNDYQVTGMDIAAGETCNHALKGYTFIKADLTATDNIRHLFASVVDLSGRLDALVTCAGITSLSKIDEISSEEWDAMLAINLKSVFFCCKAAFEFMKKGKSGKIVNVSSNAGKGAGKAVGVHYSASKAGVISLTRSFAIHGADWNINVNCVAPGPTKTPMTENWGKETSDSLIDKIPLKRFANPSEIAEAIIFLLSERADYITGETLNVNGGLLMD